MHDATKQSVAARLKRIEGQVRGVLRMVEQDRYCVDVLTQVSAVRAALHKVEEQILRDHVSHCVAGAFVSGDPVEQRHKVEELVGHDRPDDAVIAIALKGSMGGIPDGSARDVCGLHAIGRAISHRSQLAARRFVSLSTWLTRTRSRHAA